MSKVSARALGTYIRQKRIEKGISRDEFADKLNVTKGAVAKWEQGLRMPDFGTIGDIADALDVSVQEIYDNSIKNHNIKPTTIVTFWICLGIMIPLSTYLMVAVSKKNVNEMYVSETANMENNNNSFEISEVLNELDSKKISGNNDSSTSFSRHDVLTDLPEGSKKKFVQAADILCDADISESGSLYDGNICIADQITAEAYILSDGSIYAVVLEMEKDNDDFARVIIMPDRLPDFMGDNTAEDDYCESAERVIDNCRIVVREYFCSENGIVPLSDNLDIGIDKNGIGIWIICSVDGKDMVNQMINYLLKTDINLDGLNT